MERKPNRIREYFCIGSLFALAYLCLYEIILVSTLRPTPRAIDHIFEIRNAQSIGWVIGGSLISRVLQSLSFPMQAVGLNLFPSEPYFQACVYLPFTSSVQWFFYGCLFCWWRKRRNAGSTGDPQASMPAQGE